MGAQWLSGRVLDSRPRGHGFEPHLRHCIVSLSKNINPSLVLVQHRKTRPFITERLLMRGKESNQTKTQGTSVQFLKSEAATTVCSKMVSFFTQNLKITKKSIQCITNTFRKTHE